MLQVCPGETVYIYKLARLGRSLKHLLDLVADLQRRDIGLISLTDAINTASAQGWLVLNLFASLAECERELIRDRYPLLQEPDVVKAMVIRSVHASMALESQAVSLAPRLASLYVQTVPAPFPQP
ncbi:hypothetical protein GCM10028824_33060 [Hymenobacter segetis]